MTAADDPGDDPGDVVATIRARGPARGLDHAWPRDARTCRRLQTALAGYLEIGTTGAHGARWVAGVDVGFGERGQTTRAAAVVMDVATGDQCDAATVCRPTRMPYIPGLLSFREVPAALEALAALTTAPELLMVDGHGIAHPRRLGIAAHLGLVTGLASLGVAKKRLTGTHAAVAATPGARQTLYDGEQPLGVVLRSRRRANPIIVSPGHRMDVATALAWTEHFLTGYRLPEPTRRADRMASQRDNAVPPRL